MKPADWMKSGSSAADDSWCLHGIRRIIFKMQIHFTRFFQFFLEGTRQHPNVIIFLKYDRWTSDCPWILVISLTKVTNTNTMNQNWAPPKILEYSSELSRLWGRLAQQAQWGGVSNTRGFPAWVEMTSSSMEMWHIEPASPQNKSPDEDSTLADLQ